MSQTIYVVTESGAQAQYGLEQVEAMWRSGHLKPDALYWTEGMSEWRPLSEYFAAPSASGAAGAGSPPEIRVEGAEFHGYAGFWKRAVAMFLDWIVLVVLGGVVGGIVGFLYGSASPGAGSREAAGYLGQFGGSIAAWLYFALMESSSKQATLGKMALDMKVTDAEGRRLSFGRATGRHFAKILSGIILLIGYFMAAFTKKKQALHDIIADCLVVNE